ncbi:hypothetical protein [Halopenitus persicus]|uniref:DUF8103 domain-containing protein n=1 Tax=Halopenitus persicus TaxID=1048396 RepID=A0A1H3HF90_9EURY|nr:hypothetical protein [Halopenitus persicus]SDY14137.1 hypothetical protein SAMN05216564_103254 [Halopenitus persicus]
MTDTNAVDWEILKEILDAQVHINVCLEQYLLYVTHEDADLDREEIVACLDQAIESHERAMADLDAARRTIRTTS